MQKTSRSLERGFLLVAGGTGIDKAPSVLSQSGPPEAMLHDLLSPLDPRVASEFGAVSPLEDLGAEVRYSTGVLVDRNWVWAGPGWRL